MAVDNARFDAHMNCLQAAEALFDRDGDFLVRDSSSAPGDYVLSCFWKNEPLHFKIIRVVLRPKQVCPRLTSRTKRLKRGTSSSDGVGGGGAAILKHN